MVVVVLVTLVRGAAHHNRCFRVRFLDLQRGELIHAIDGRHRRPPVSARREVHNGHGAVGLDESAESRGGKARGGAQQGLVDGVVRDDECCAGGCAGGAADAVGEDGAPRERCAEPQLSAEDRKSGPEGRKLVRAGPT